MIKLNYPYGATPIDANESQGLIPNISFQSELNQFERDNIRDAMRWADRSRKLRKALLSIDGIKQLHERMFGEVWQWAGTFRKSEKNIGNVSWYQVPEEAHKLLADIRFQISIGVEDWNLLAVTFHHRLVSIHPFPNGNGRHARMCADLLLSFNNQPLLSWGDSELISDDIVRKNYIQALRAADSGNLQPLLLFSVGK